MITEARQLRMVGKGLDSSLHVTLKGHRPSDVRDGTVGRYKKLKKRGFP